MKLFKAQEPSRKVGLGLRVPHIDHVLKNHQKISKKIGWFEVHSENYYALGGQTLKTLLKVREHFQISLHCVGNSLGSAQQIDKNHVKKLKELADIVQPFLVSDHISWGMIDKNHLNDLLPLPYNQQSLKAVCNNVSLMQNILQREILVENPSSYLAFNNSEMDEADFINSIAKSTGCKFLLDVNNIFVSAKNNSSFDPAQYLKKIDKKIVKEIHLAGHSINEIFDGKNYKEILIDTHNNLVRKEVWSLYATAIARFGQIPSLIEWDQDIPEFKVLLEEAARAQKILG